jgi:L-iditol 2-dehydrogenase
MRAALLFGPGDLRVREVAEPEGEVVVEVRAASACGTDVKMLRHGHRILGGYPCGLGHETAGTRLDTGEPVLVGDSVACEACAPCRAGRRQLCREMSWVLGGFAERIAAPAAALHPIPDGLPFAAAAMAEPLAAAVHALSRAPAGTDVGILGGGTMGQFLARLAILDGRRVTLADRHPERRRQAEALGARAVELLGTHDVVLEAVGRVEAWEQALGAVAPGGCLVLVGGCPAGSAVRWPTAPLHYDEVDVRGAFHHDRAEVDRALALLAGGDVPWEAFRGETVGLDALGAALARPAAGEARKLVVEPGPGG